VRKCLSEVNMVQSSFQPEDSSSTNWTYVNSRKELVRCYIWSIALYDAETWTSRKVAQS
jgi:hypothetical protein